jgi:uncharacterized membrane protein
VETQAVIDWWPIVSGIIAVAAIAVAFRAEILVRVKVLEEKVAALFDILNRPK